CENNKKIAIYAGISIAALGAYFSYKTYKRIKNNQEEMQYIDNENYEINNLRDDLEGKELKEKVDEFNSRRISSENCEDVEQNDVKKYVDSIKEDKENININEDEYNQEKYDEYDE
ncbi:MAG: hypothetical protein IJ094_08865, partial [Bacilli bacterium]|nr:hypothetical protein [Bacilli bacterium]